MSPMLSVDVSVTLPIFSHTTNSCGSHTHKHTQTKAHTHIPLHTPSTQRERERAREGLLLKMFQVSILIYLPPATQLSFLHLSAAVSQTPGSIDHWQAERPAMAKQLSSFMLLPLHSNVQGSSTSPPSFHCLVLHYSIIYHTGPLNWLGQARLWSHLSSII